MQNSLQKNNETGSGVPAVKFLIGGMLAFLITVVCLFVITSDNLFSEQPTTFSELGGDFSLQSKRGVVSLSDYRDKVVVIYFGFLTCPEVCPNSMSVIQRALTSLTSEELAQTQAMLVSVDPKRDSIDKLAEYTEYYHSNLLGLTGSKAEIDAVTRQFGAYYDFTEIESVTAEYGVEHSSRYYVVDKNGKLVAAMRHSTTPNELLSQMRELL